MQLQIYYLKEWKITLKPPSSSTSSSWRDPRPHKGTLSGEMAGYLVNWGPVTLWTVGQDSAQPLTRLLGLYVVALLFLHLVCINATEIMFSINVRESERVKESKNRLQFFSLKVVCAKNAQILSYINYKSWSLFSESADCCFKVNFSCHSSIPCYILSAVKSYIGFWWPLNYNLFTVN